MPAAPIGVFPSKTLKHHTGVNGYASALGAFAKHLFSEGKVVGDPGIEPGVRLREGVTVPCHTLRPVAHFPDLAVVV